MHDVTVTFKVVLKSHYTLHNLRLAIVTSAKYLGVTSDTKLSFNRHVVITCKKANSVPDFLCRSLRSCQRKITTGFYLTYVKPILNYSVLVWSLHTNCVINHLCRLNSTT